MAIKFTAMIAAALLLPIPAKAQSEVSSQVQALFLRVNSEVSANLQCVANAIVLADQLKEAQQKLKALQEKYEPTPDKKSD